MEEKKKEEEDRKEREEEECVAERTEARGFVLDSELRMVDADGQPFDMERASVRLFDAMGARVAAEMDTLLTARAGLERVVLTGAPGIEHTTVYATPGLQARTAPLLVVIPGAGKVFNGVMSRRVSLHESLHTGTCWDDVLRAQARGWSVLVLNANERPCRRIAPPAREHDEAAARECFHMGRFRGGRAGALVLDGCWAVDADAWAPEEYAQHVWARFVAPARAAQIFVLAHSAGGELTCELLGAERDAAVLARVAAVALADSVHIDTVPRGDPRRALFEDAARIVNWVRSPLPLDTPLAAGANGVATRSAGTTDHGETTSRARECMWALFLSRLDSASEAPSSSSTATPSSS